MVGISEYLTDGTVSYSILTVVLKRSSRMATDNMSLFISALARPNTNTQTVPQNMSKENPRRSIKLSS